MRTRPISCGTFLAAALLAPAALAGNGLETPDAGALQVGRGGAWVARADDPLKAKRSTILDMT